MKLEVHGVIWGMKYQCEHRYRLEDVESEISA